MPALQNRQITMATRPEGEPRPENFRLVTGEAPQPGPGQVLVKTQYLSLDPYMRGRMSTARSYSKPLEPGDVIVGQTVSKVVASNDRASSPATRCSPIPAGRITRSPCPATLRKLDPKAGPISTGARRSRHAGHDRLYRAPQYRPAEARRDGRGGGRDRPGRLRRRSDRQAQGLPRRRHRWGRRQVQSADAGVRLRCGRRSP